MAAVPVGAAVSWSPYREERKVVSSSSSSGIGVMGATFIVLLVLKLLGKIAWSWWWVTAPLWGGLGLVIGVLLLVGLGALVFAGVGALLDRLGGKP